MASALLATPACAHGFGQRYDLPIPLSFYLIGTAAAVVVSFVIVALFVRERPRPHADARIDLTALETCNGGLGRPHLARDRVLRNAKALALSYGWLLPVYRARAGRTIEEMGRLGRG